MSYDDYKWKKRKYYIRINCWIIIGILVAILCFLFPIVSDAAEVEPIPEGYTSFADYFHVDTSNIYGSDIYEVPQGCVDPFDYDFTHEYLVGLFDNDMSNGEVIIDNDFLEHEIVYTVDNQSYSVFDFSDYMMTYMGLYDYFQCRLVNAGFSSESYNPNLIFAPNGLYFGSNYNFDYERSFSGYEYPSTVINSTKLPGYPSNIYVFNLSTFSDYAFGYTDVNYFGMASTDPQAVYSQRLIGGSANQGNTLIATNSPFVYTVKPSERNGALDWIYLDNSGSINEYRSNIYGSPWYQIGPSHEPDNDNTYPDGSGGSDENNLYMRTADWTFNIPKYWPSVTSSTVQSQYVNNWGQGYINFSGLLNDYQKDNSDNFDINFKFHIWASGHYFSDVTSSINGNFYGSFDYSDSVSLTSFINNNNTVSFSVKDIFELSTNSNGDYFDDFIDDEMKGHQSIDNWNWYITCDAFLSAADKSSGHITEKYNFISQVSEETSNNITDNTNPFIPDPDDPNYNPDNFNPDNDSNTTTSKNGINITITNNNDPTFNNNNNFNPINSVIPDGDGGTDENGDNLLTWIVKKLFGYIDALVGGIFDASGLNDNNDGVTQNSLVTGDSLGSSNNGFLAFMNNTFSFIPQGMWDVLQYFFTVSIVILVIAFLIRIILDIL